MKIVLSHYQTKPLFQAKQSGEKTAISSHDLGMSMTEIVVKPEGAIFPEDEMITWEVLSDIHDSETGCFHIEDGTAYKIQRFSEETNRYYSLYPTESAPTILISGTLMHRIKGINPWEDTSEKIAALGHITGKVLDTSTGLGYTAIRASESAEKVVTTELDPAVLSVAELNPWSEKLFSSPHITQYTNDIADQITEFDDNYFQGIIHDPPVITMAGDLYGSEFYAQLFRVMASGGRLFHYIGDPDSKSGKRVTGGVIQRLQDAGFYNVRKAPKAFGVTGRK